MYRQERVEKALPPPQRLALPPCTGAAMLLSQLVGRVKDRQPPRHAAHTRRAEEASCSSPFPSLAGVTTLYPGPCRHLRSSGKRELRFCHSPSNVILAGHLPHAQHWAPVHSAGSLPTWGLGFPGIQVFSDGGFSECSFGLCLSATDVTLDKPLPFVASVFPSAKWE